MVTPLLTAWVFAGFVVLLALQRLVELLLSRRNEARILAAGGRERAPEQMPVMRAIHTSWFLAMLAEVFLLERPFVPVIALAAALLFVAGQILRYAAIRSLGWRWTVRIMTLPGEPPIQQGVYRYIRHPNYLGVTLEIAAVPLMHMAYLTAILYSVFNALFLFWRIQAEENALREQHPYDRHLEERPRFFPKLERE